MIDTIEITIRQGQRHIKGFINPDVLALMPEGHRKQYYCEQQAAGLMNRFIREQFTTDTKVIP